LKFSQKKMTVSNIELMYFAIVREDGENKRHEMTQLFFVFP